MLEKMRENQKRHYKNRKSVHTFKVGDLVLLRKLNKDKLELKWETNYRITRLPQLCSAVVENQFTGRTKRCNVSDLQIKHPAEDWDLKPATIGRATDLSITQTTYLMLTLSQIKQMMLSNHPQINTI